MNNFVAAKGRNYLCMYTSVTGTTFYIYKVVSVAKKPFDLRKFFGIC